MFQVRLVNIGLRLRLRRACAQGLIQSNKTISSHESSIAQFHFTKTMGRSEQRQREKRKAAKFCTPIGQFFQKKARTGKPVKWSKCQSFWGLHPLTPHLDPASGPQTPCLWEFHFLEKEPPNFQTSLRACATDGKNEISLKNCSRFTRKHSQHCATI